MLPSQNKTKEVLVTVNDVKGDDFPADAEQQDFLNHGALAKHLDFQTGGANAAKYPGAPATGHCATSTTLGST